MDDEITLEVVAPVPKPSEEDGPVRLRVVYNIVRPKGPLRSSESLVDTAVCLVTARNKAEIKRAKRVYVMEPKRKDRLKDPLGLWREAGITMERVASEGLRLVMTTCEEHVPGSSRYPKPMEASR